MSLEDERALFRKWRAGDRASGSVLLSGHYRSLELFFSTKIARRAQIDDLLQQTFLCCVESPEGSWEHGSFRAHLLTIAREVVLRHFRSQRDHGQHFEALETSVEDLGQGPFEVVMERADQRELAAALRKIPLDFQITLELVYWHGLNTSEVAQVLGIAQTTVRTRVLRSKRRLRDMMAGQVTVGSVP